MTNRSSSGIDPHRRAGEAAVAEGAVAEQLAAIGRVAAAVVPAEGAAIAGHVARAKHFGFGGAAHD